MAQKTREYIISDRRIVCTSHFVLKDGIVANDSTGEVCAIFDTEAEEQLHRCGDCKWLGRETPVAGEYRYNRTERMTRLEDFCSRAVVRDA